MRALCILVFLFGTCTILQAQSFDDKKIDNPASEAREDYSAIFKTDKVSFRPAGDEAAKSDVMSKAGIDFSIVSQPFFKTIHNTDSDNTIWLLGHLDEEPSKSTEAQAEDWVQSALEHLAMNDAHFSFKNKSIQVDPNGDRHIRMQQNYKDIPVYAAEIILHEKNGQFYMMNGKLIDSKLIKPLKSQVIDEPVARDRVKNALPNYRDNALEFEGIEIEHGVQQWESTRVYYPVEKGEYRLAYHFKVYANAAERFDYFVDAGDATIIDYFSNICKFHADIAGQGDTHSAYDNTTHKHEGIQGTIGEHSLLDGPSTANANDLSGINRLINTYEFSNSFFLIDASRPMFNQSQSVLPDNPIGAIWTIDMNNTSPINENSLFTHVLSQDNSWNSSPEGVSAHYNAGLAYEYFRDIFNRESITGTGQSIISFVNVTDEFENSMGNAFWNGIGIYYGNGDASFESLGRALDVAGHEMSHGVIESTANLEYRNESGAMNEAFADIFGAMIDREDWLIGEDVVKLTAFPSGALRNMMDPHNGAATGDLARGWQPSHYDERYTGSEDNGGVHINSGIINHAFYLFANQVGRETAEQVYYRALTTYLLRSSDFKELRFAVLQSAVDLYGNSVAQSAAQAFDSVGITDGEEIVVDSDFAINPGTDLLLVSDQSLSQLYLFNLQTGEEIYNPLSSTPLLSKPSITDDGTRIVFVGTDNHVHLIELDWSVSPPAFTESVITNDPDWRNAVISKNGRFIALLENVVSNKIIVIDLLNGDFNEFELTNPTYTEGLSTGEVQYADVMEFDATSTRIMYDAFNEVRGNTGTIEFWDVGFLEVWNSEFETWALGNIEKLFSNLPEGINIGNPTFSKNSPYIIALDIFEGSTYEIIGINLETQAINTVFPNTGLGYPSYSRDDAFMVYDLEIFGYTDLGILGLESDKISRIANSDEILLTGGKWGNWFSNGSRVLSSTENLDPVSFGVQLRPNPVSDFLDLSINNEQGTYYMTIVDMNGKLIKRQILQAGEQRIMLDDMSSGVYILQLEDGKRSTALKFVKK